MAWYKPWTWGDESESATEQRDNLGNQAGMAGWFGDVNQDEYQNLGNEASAERDYLRKLASGQESVSAEQLRQGVQQNVAAQRSMAQGGAPQNAAMAARSAAINAGRIGSGMAGQQALAGLQERQNAHKSLADMILGQRQQSLQGALGSRQTAIQGYGGQKAEGSFLDKWGNAAAGAGAIIAKSDRRAKSDIEDGDVEAKRALEGLRSYTFKYKNEKDGKGRQLGVMAQDLEKAGLKHAVIDTPDGKYVHGGKLATANTAMLSALERRVSKMERGK